MAAWRGGGAPRRLSRLERSATSRRATCGGPIHIGTHDTRYGKRNATRRDATGSYPWHFALLVCFRAFSRVARVLGVVVVVFVVVASRRAAPPAIFDEPPSDSKVRSSTYTVRHGTYERRRKRERRRGRGRRGPSASAENERAGVERG